MIDISAAAISVSSLAETGAQNPGATPSATNLDHRTERRTPVSAPPQISSRQAVDRLGQQTEIVTKGRNDPLRARPHHAGGRGDARLRAGGPNAVAPRAESGRARGGEAAGELIARVRRVRPVPAQNR